MTAQRADTILINEEEHIIYSCPLEQYWLQNNNKPDLCSLDTDSNRGYYAKWLIEHNQLFLIDFYGQHFFRGVEYSLRDIFPLSNEKVFAEWFTADIRIPLGKPVHYFHGGWGATFEYNTTIKFCNGLVIDSGAFLIE